VTPQVLGDSARIEQSVGDVYLFMSTIWISTFCRSAFLTLTKKS
jgi:hypothetical protein